MYRFDDFDANLSPEDMAEYDRYADREEWEDDDEVFDDGNDFDDSDLD